MSSDKIVAIEGKWLTKTELLDMANSKLATQLPPYQESFWRFVMEWFNGNDFVELKTSGSTGIPTQIIVKKAKMRASASRTLKFLDIRSGDKALICLNCDYVAGKMMIVRALEGNLNLILRDATSNPLENLIEAIDFAAMVPLQVLFYKENPLLLNIVKTLIIGGASVSNQLETVLMRSSTMAYETYGMTETVSHIALRLVNGEGRKESFTALEGVEIDVDARGALIIRDEFTLDAPLITNDVIDRVSEREFRITGRVDNIINSGGIKISPEEIERQISPVLAADFLVSWVSDSKLGQKMVLVCTQTISDKDLEGINSLLPKFYKIHKVFNIHELPLTETGKINRLKVQGLIDLGALRSGEGCSG